MILHQIKVAISQLLPNKSIKSSKEEWDELAEENHRYYIVSREGRNIDENTFRDIGKENYEDLIVSDPLVPTQGVALDIGCGVGRITEYMADRYEHVYGVDISEKMIEKAKARVKKDNITFFANDGEHYHKIENDSVDFVFSYIVFQHMPSHAVVRENIKDIKRVLKKGGIAKVQLRGKQKVLKSEWFYGKSYSKETARKLFDELGLQIIKMGDDSRKKKFFIWFTK